MDNSDQGHFAEKQLFSRIGLLRWSHGTRFRVAVEKSAAFKGRRVLDFGCGDATYFSLLLQSPHPPAAMVGMEIGADVIEANVRRFAASPQVSFVDLPGLDAPEHAGAYDAVVCMEVFEHLIETEATLDQLCRLIRPGGRLLLSVPVETGLPVIVKLIVRRLAALRGMHGYDSTVPYTWGEFFRSVFAGSDQHIKRIIHKEGDRAPVHCHKGFNWRLLRDQIAKRMRITDISGSPIGWLPASMGSQVWFEAVKPG